MKEIISLQFPNCISYFIKKQKTNFIYFRNIGFLGNHQVSCNDVAKEKLKAYGAASPVCSHEEN